MRGTSFRDYVMAVNRVEERLRKVTAAMEAAGVKYAVIGGNAVAAWVARVDPQATRSTKDVDILCDRAEESKLNNAMLELGFTWPDVLGVSMFIDPEEPSARNAVHVIWANEHVRPEYHAPAPGVDESVRDPQEFLVLNIPALVRMKLTSFRRIDQVHIEDLLRMN
jgi:hypothetical protein